ncbi:MAG: tetratricopeptide repeat protein, partial [Rhodocyclaceae bacterium]
MRIRPVDRPSSALGQAVVLLRQGDPARAEAIALQTTNDDPACARAWFLLGAARHARRKPAEALPAFGRALELDPDLVEARRALTTVLLEL